MNRPPFCFIVMPFRRELNFFYLYIKQYLEGKYGLRVERGDSDVITKPLMDKVRKQIIDADVIIGDVTGNTPNVFYELGLAHAYDKPVIFLTQDPPESAPVDIRQFEFIHYDLARHDEFLLRLDNAIQNIFLQRYRELYRWAVELLMRFNADNASSYSAASIEDFQVRVMQREQGEGIPPPAHEDLLAQFLLPRILQDVADAALMQRVLYWLSVNFPSS